LGTFTEGAGLANQEARQRRLERLDHDLRAVWKNGHPWYNLPCVYCRLDRLKTSHPYFNRSPFQHSAYHAWKAFHWRDRRTADTFLKDLFSSWASYSEERKSALREALFAELEKGWKRPRNDSPPWLDRESSAPKAYLAKRIFLESKTIIKQRHQRDSFAERTAETPLGCVPIRGAGLGNEELRDRDLDKHDARVQALERIAATGRKESRQRAQIALRVLCEGRDGDEAREALGGENAWRALKTTARNEFRKT
jgi:hypothetical protein